MIANVSTAEIIQHHTDAFIAHNMDELMKTYSEKASLCSRFGRINGLDSIRTFLISMSPLFPPGKTSFEIFQTIIIDDKGFIAWRSDSPVAEIPIGTSSFQVKDGKITWHTVSAHIVEK